MSDLSAFIAGLIIGDTSSPPPKRKVKLPASNVALQDVVFCQCLANIIAELDKYVKTSHPSPQEFIEHIIPKPAFSEPYTTDEEKQLKKREDNIADYIDWIEGLEQSGNLIGDDGNPGATWANISALRMVWQDVKHTPDPDNLDLLFSLETITKPVKHKRSVYEYKDSFPLYGMAQGFFDSVPAKEILRQCIDCASGIIKGKKLRYDHTRFEFNASADKNGNLLKWKQEQRVLAYKAILREYSRFAEVSWSDMTRQAHVAIEYEPKISGAKLDRKHKKEREEEIKKVYDTLNANEIERYSHVNVAIKDWKSGFFDMLIGIFVILAVVIFIIAAITSAFNEAAANVIVIVALSFAGAAILIGMSYIFRPTKHYRNHVVCNYLRTLQWAYYQKDGSQQATEYEDLLKRI